MKHTLIYNSATRMTTHQITDDHGSTYSDLPPRNRQLTALIKSAAKALGKRQGEIRTMLEAGVPLSWSE